MAVGARGIRAGKGYVELYADSTRLARGLRKAQAKMRAFSASMNKMGLGMLKLSMAMAAPLVLGIKAFSDFETQMANVSTMLDEPEKHMDAFRKGVSKLSVEFGESTETLAKGLYDILSASVAPSKALFVLAESAKAAKGGLADTGVAADAVTTIMNAFNLEAENAADVFDLLFTIVKHGKITFPEIADGIGLVATSASSAGVSLEEMGAAIATITRSGIRPQRTIIGLNAIISTFLKPTGKAAKAARELGFELSSATIRAKGLSGVFNMLAGMDPDAIAKIFPNIRALRGVLPLLGNIVLFTEDIGNMTDRAGNSTRAYLKIINTLRHRMAQFKQAVVAAGRAIGAALAPALGRAAERLRGIIETITLILEKNPKLIQTFAKITLIVAGVGLALMALGVIGSIAAFVFGGLASIVGAVVAVFGTLLAIVGFILSPIGLLLTAIVAVAANLVYTTGIGAKALAWLGTKFVALKDVAVTAWKGMASALMQGNLALAAKILWLSLKVEWQRGIHYLNTQWSGFKDFFLSTATDAFYGAVSLLANGLAGLEIAWAETTAFMANQWVNFTSGIMHAWNVAQGWLAKRWIDIMGLFDETLEVDVVKNAIDEETGRLGERIETGAREALGAREKKRQDDRARIERDRTGTQAAIWEEADAINEKRRAQYATDIEASQGALAAARAEWKAAMEEVKEGALDGEGGPDAGIDSIKKLADTLGAVGSPKAIEGAVVGSFSAAGVDRMGYNSAAERTAKATEETAENTSDLSDRLDDLAAEFG